jgi:hypothetical protein
MSRVLKTFFKFGLNPSNRKKRSAILREETFLQVLLLFFFDKWAAVLLNGETLLLSYGITIIM